MKAAFFDFDGTLINGTSEYLFFQYLIRTKRISLIKSLLRFAILPLAKLRFDSMLFKEYKPYLHNIKKVKLNEYAEEFYKKKIKKRIRKDIIKRMIGLKKQGYKIVLVTSTLNILIDPFLKEYNIKNSFSSLYTPTKRVFHKAIKNPIPFGENKKIYIREFTKKHKVRLEESYAFSDSKSDKEMLEIVGKPVWV